MIFDLLQWQEIATLSLLEKAAIASFVSTTFRGYFCLGANDITRNRSRVIFSRACANIFCRWRTFSIWSIDSCQNRIATDQYPMTIWRAHVSTHGGDVIYLEAVRWPVNCFTRSRTIANNVQSHTFTSLGAQETDNAHILDINVLINWQLSKQGTRWPVSLDRIAGSGVDPSRSSIFLKLSADKLLLFKWSQAQVQVFS